MKTNVIIPMSYKLSTCPKKGKKQAEIQTMFLRYKAMSQIKSKVQEYILKNNKKVKRKCCVYVYLSICLSTRSLEMPLP